MTWIETDFKYLEKIGKINGEGVHDVAGNFDKELIYQTKRVADNLNWLCKILKNKGEM